MIQLICLPYFLLLSKSPDINNKEINSNEIRNCKLLSFPNNNHIY